MEIYPGEKIGTATLITGLGYTALFRCSCGEVFTAGRVKVDRAIYGDQKPYCKPTPPVPLMCGKCVVNGNTMTV